MNHRKIGFRHAAPRNFNYEGPTIPLIVQAFRELTEQNIRDQEISAVSKYLDKAPDKSILAKDILNAPMWIQNIIKPLIKKYEK